MCGLYRLTIAPEAMKAAFSLAEGPELANCCPRALVRPGEPAPIIRREEDGAYHLRFALWGFVPHWMKEWPKQRPINARAESLLERPYFRSAVRHHRCLFPADGFHEWTGQPGHKHAILFTLPDERPFAMAGLWSRWMGADGSEMETCVIITVDANADVRPVHPRMPAIFLNEADRAAWLDPACPAEEAVRLLKPAPDGTFSGRDVGHPLKHPPEQPRLL